MPCESLKKMIAVDKKQILREQIQPRERECVCVSTFELEESFLEFGSAALAVQVRNSHLYRHLHTDIMSPNNRLVSPRILFCSTFFIVWFQFLCLYFERERAYLRTWILDFSFFSFLPSFLVRSSIRDRWDGARAIIKREKGCLNSFQSV